MINDYKLDLLVDEALARDASDYNDADLLEAKAFMKERFKSIIEGPYHQFKSGDKVIFKGLPAIVKVIQIPPVDGHVFIEFESDGRLIPAKATSLTYNLRK